MLRRSMGLVLKVIENCGGKITEKNKNEKCLIFKE